MNTSIRPAFAGLVTISALATATASTVVIDFEDVPLGPGGFNNGSDGSGKITSSGVDFLNSYNPEFGSWAGFAVSSITDNTTPGWGNQYSSFAGSGVGSSTNYSVGYTGAGPSTVEFGGTIDLGDGGGAWLTNTTYAALSMQNGDSFAKAFGGVSGTDEDWFLLTIQGFDGVTSTGIIEFYLADYRFADDSLDYIINEWTYVDFSSLGEVDRLEFGLTSSDVGSFGMNTPAYFSMDNLTIPEPSVTTLMVLAGSFLLRRKRD